MKDDASSSSNRSVEDYIASIPVAARPKFDELRDLVKKQLPEAHEVMSYGVVGYRTSNTRAKVFISGWKDHIAMYPIPRDEQLRAELAPYAKGKGTLWFGLDTPLPIGIIARAVASLSDN